MSKKKYLVYIAGPITKGDKMENLAQAIKAWNQVADHPLLCPVCPHTSILAEMTKARPHEDWMAIDLPILSKCDFLLRLPGESKGADQEVKFAESNGIPVVHHIADLAMLVDHREHKTKSPSLKRPYFIVGLAGRPGVGKTTTAQATGCGVVSFADPIKKALAAMGIVKQGTDDVVYRRMAQAIGETARSTNPNLFIKKMREDLDERNRYLTNNPARQILYFVDDLRYENERDFVDLTVFLTRKDVSVNNSADRESEKMCEELQKIAPKINHDPTLVYASINTDVVNHRTWFLDCATGQVPAAANLLMASLKVKFPNLIYHYRCS